MCIRDSPQRVQSHRPGQALPVPPPLSGREKRLHAVTLLINAGLRYWSEMKIKLYQGDLPDGLKLGPVVAIDTETLGLNPFRDRLCLAQLSSGDGTAHAVQFAPGQYTAPNLK